MPVRLGLLGCGRIVQLVYLKLLTRLPGARLVALAEPDGRRRSEAASLAPEAWAVESYEEILARPDIDAAVICLPNDLHAAAAVAALECGKHIYLEKPLATHAADAVRVMARWRATGLVGMMGFNFRFNALYRAAREAVGAGKLGRPVGAISVFSTRTRTLPPWQRARATGGGVLLNLASHHFDLVYFLFSMPVREVSAQLRSQRTEHDSASVQLRLADGMVVQSLFSMNAAQEDRFEVYGEEGKLTIDRLRGTATLERFGGTAARGTVERLGPPLAWPARAVSILRWSRARAGEPSYRAALESFIGAVGRGTNASPDIADGYRSLLLVEAAEASAGSGATAAPVPPAEDHAARSN